MSFVLTKTCMGHSFVFSAVKGSLACWAFFWSCLLALFSLVTWLRKVTHLGQKFVRGVGGRLSSLSYSPFSFSFYSFDSISFSLLSFFFFFYHIHRFLLGNYLCLAVMVTGMKVILIIPRGCPIFYT